MRLNFSMTQDADIVFLKELFDVPDLKVEKLRPGNYDIYMSGFLVLWCLFDGENLELAKPQNMNVRKKFTIKDKSISEIRKCIENMWINNYIELSK